MNVPTNGFSEFEQTSFAEALKGRLMERRLLVVHEPLTEALVARVGEQIALLTAQSEAPVNVLLGLWGGDAACGLALHDAFQSAPVRAVATGRMSGMGLVAFCGAAERFALPDAHFRLEEPTGTARGASLRADAGEIADRSKRVVTLLAQATGQPPEDIERDLKEGRHFAAEEAVAYGLVGRIVQSPRDVN